MMDGVAEYLVDFIGALGVPRFQRPCLSARPRHTAKSATSDIGAYATVGTSEKGYQPWNLMTARS